MQNIELHKLYKPTSRPNVLLFPYKVSEYDTFYECVYLSSQKEDEFYFCIESISYTYLFRAM